MCDQRRRRSACASAQADQSLHWSHVPSTASRNPKRYKWEPLLYWVTVQTDLSLYWSHRGYWRFCRALAQIRFLSDRAGKSVEDIWYSFTDILNMLIKECIPSKVIRDKSLPWATQDIKRHRKRDRLYGLIRRLGTYMYIKEQILDPEATYQKEHHLDWMMRNRNLTIQNCSYFLKLSIRPAGTYTIKA